MALPTEEDQQLFDRDMLEGNYTTYTHMWTNAITNGLTYPRISQHIDTLRNMYYQEWESAAGWDRFGVYNLDTGAVVYESPVAANYIWQFPNAVERVFISNTTLFDRASSHARYVLIVRADGFTIEVWKDGAMLWTIPITTPDPLATTVDLVTMSQDGRWILVVTDTPNVVCFRGD